MKAIKTIVVSILSWIFWPLLKLLEYCPEISFRFRSKTKMVGGNYHFTIYILSFKHEEPSGFQQPWVMLIAEDCTGYPNGTFAITYARSIFSTDDIIPYLKERWVKIWHCIKFDLLLLYGVAKDSLKGRYAYNNNNQGT